MDTPNLSPYYDPRPPSPVYVPTFSFDYTPPSPVYCPQSPASRPPSPVYIPPSPIYYPPSPALCYPPSPTWVPSNDRQAATRHIPEPRRSFSSTPTTVPEPEPERLDPSVFSLNFPVCRPRLFTSLPDPKPDPDPQPSRKRARLDEREDEDDEQYLPAIREIKSYIKEEKRKIRDATERIRKWRRSMRMMKGG